MYKIAYLTDTGLKRKINEDTLLVANLCNLFVVTDGMGGHEKGEVASKIVVDSFQQTLCQNKDLNRIDSNQDETIAYENREFNNKNTLNKKLNNIIGIATEKIKTYTRKNYISGHIGTTVVGLYKHNKEEEMALFHLGDSRAYRIRDGKIKRLTTDHSKYEKMKQSGRYSKEELSKVNRNSITKAIGNFKVMSLEIKYIDLKEKDIYILCTDGVSDLTHASELLEIIVERESNLNEATLEIRKLIYERGAKDNLSMIIFQYKS